MALRLRMILEGRRAATKGVHFIMTIASRVLIPVMYFRPSSIDRRRVAAELSRVRSRIEASRESGQGSVLEGEPQEGRCREGQTACQRRPGPEAFQGQPCEGSGHESQQGWRYAQAW